MSSSQPQKIDWLVIAPDKPGTLEKRMAVRSAHLSNISARADAGFWKLGGAMLTEPPKDAEPLAINGSAMMAYAATRDEVWEELKRDVYAKEVWDLEKVQIIPFKTAFRKE